MSSSSPAPESWISAFCALVGHEYFAEVSEDFVEDDFNLTGLQSQVPMYKEALEMILDVEPEDVSDEEDEEDEEEDDDDDMQDEADAAFRRDTAAERRHLRMASDLSVIESSAEMLYGLIHQRFITSRVGIQQMAEKYEMGHFGHCPRVHCHAAKVLPVGCSDIPGQETVKLFCPSCLDVYTPPNSRFQSVDGAFFGTTFGCLFFMTFPDLDVAGRMPPAYDDPAAASLNGANGQQQQQSSSRSLSSSLTSQAPAGPQAASSSHPASNLPSQQQPQPDTINGVATRNLAPGLGPGRVYEPRIYGFRVSELARMGPRMKWLRSRPGSVVDLDESRLWAQTQQQMRLAQQAQQLHHQNQQQQQVGAAGPPDENADFADSEMLDPEPDKVGDHGEDMDDVDENADLGDDGHEQAQVREVAQRKKAGRRRRQSQLSDARPNGDVGGGGGAALRVGDGG